MKRTLQTVCYIKELVAVRTKTGGDTPRMLVQGGNNGRGATKYTGTKYLGGPNKSTRLTRKYVYEERRKKGKNKAVEMLTFSESRGCAESSNNQRARSNRSSAPPKILIIHGLAK